MFSEPGSFCQDANPVVVVGAAVRFPGDAVSQEEYWQMLLQGQNAYTDFPEDRIHTNGYYHPSGDRKGSINFKGAHFLKGNIQAFDASMFNVSALEATAMDPQQRLLLETAYHALENAGISRESIAGSDTSVHIGAFVRDYQQISMGDPDWSPKYAVTGTAAAILSNRVSHAFDLRGPSKTIDTGCSGSLVAFNDAVNDLKSGRVPIAIAGGVGLIMTPITMIPMTALGFLSKDGRSWTFTDRANGYGRGEGAGMLVMKRLSDAIRDNDTIRAVVTGSRVNQDGRTPGITFPNAESQLANITEIYRETGLDVNDTTFVECHGTGTTVGDVQETKALTQAFCEHRRRNTPLLIGSVKPNIGHLEAAAGVAGLVKAMLCLERRMIPPNVYFHPKIANKGIKFDEWKLKVPTKTIPWPKNGFPRASVNCFGFGGTNAHCILDQADRYLQDRHVGANTFASTREYSRISHHLFQFSANDEKGITRVADSIAEYVRSHSGQSNLLPELAYSLTRRSQLGFKTFVVASSVSDLLRKLENPAALPSIHAAGKKAHVTIAFSGQGAQWSAMGRELLSIPIYSESMRSADKYLFQLSAGSFGLLEELSESTDTSKVAWPHIAQPATIAVQIALVDLMRASGIQPASVIGHSSGEIAAAYAAGYVTREDAWAVAYHRGQCVSAMTYADSDLEGGMMAVRLSAEEVQAYINRLKPINVVVACENSPTSVTLSGDRGALLRLKASFRGSNVQLKVLNVSTAYHSPAMLAIADKYRTSLSDIRPHSAEEQPLCTMYSSVYGHVVQGKDLDADYWVSNLVSPVLFDSTFQRLYTNSEPDIVLEISPTIVLKPLIDDIIKHLNPSEDTVSHAELLQRDKNAVMTMLEGLGKLWVNGCKISQDWAWEHPDSCHRPKLLVDLPPYPFDHSKSYWFECTDSVVERFRKHNRQDLIGSPTKDGMQLAPIWRGFWRISENPWLLDHRVQGMVVLPAAGLITMAIQAAWQCADEHLNVQGFEVRQMTIAKPVLVPSNEHGLEHALHGRLDKLIAPALQEGVSTYSFTIYTRTETSSWQENASGIFAIVYGQEDIDATSLAHDCQYKHTSALCKDNKTPLQFYEELDVVGIQYGPLFRSITSIASGPDLAVATVAVPNTKACMPCQFEFDHIVHPATLDAMIHATLVTRDQAFVPSYFENISVTVDTAKAPGTEYNGYVRVANKGLREVLTDFQFMDAARQSRVTVKGMNIVALTDSGDSAFLKSNRSLCTEVHWRQLMLVANLTESPLDHAGVVVLVPHHRTRLGTAMKRLNFVVVTREEMTQAQLSIKICVSLLEVEKPLVPDMDMATFDFVKRLTQHSPGLLWVTASGKDNSENPGMAAFVGLARSIRSEDETRRIICLSLDEIDPEDDVHTIDAITRVTAACLVTNTTTEVELSLRGNGIWIPRLELASNLNKVIEQAEIAAVVLKSQQDFETQRPVRLCIEKIGDLSSTYFETDSTATQALQDDEIRIQVQLTSIHDVDVETLLGKTSEEQIGFDVEGDIVEIGRGVTRFEIGDRVAALGRSTIRSLATVKQANVMHCFSSLLGKHISLSALVTAYHAFEQIGHLSAGDCIFMPSMEGPYGSAALIVASLLRLKVFNAGRKRSNSIVLAHHHTEPAQKSAKCADALAEEIARWTEGRGVDLVYCYELDKLDEAFHCAGGRADVILVNDDALTRTSLTIPVEADVAFHKCNIHALLRKRPRAVAKALAAIEKLLESSNLAACPGVMDTLDNITDVLESLHHGSSAGLHVLEMQGFVRIAKCMIEPLELKSDATYVLTGGLGGLGRSIAKLMVEKGAKHLVFFARSKKPTDDQLRFMDELRSADAQVTYFSVDVCDAKRLDPLLEKWVLPPIKGVVQCAAVLRDAFWKNMTHEQWQESTRPKIIGTANLDKLMPQDLDFFVMLSSSTGAVGNQGQANYVAGNVFQDAVAHRRRKLGQKAVSLDLGMILGAGMLNHERDMVARLKSQGFVGIRHKDFLFLIERALQGTGVSGEPMPAQLVTGVGFGGLIAQNNVTDPFWKRNPMFEILNKVDLPAENTVSKTKGRGGGKLKAELKSCGTRQKAVDLIVEGLTGSIAAAINMPAAEVDDGKSLTNYGVDSLVASQLRNWIHRETDVKMTDMEILAPASIRDLAKEIAVKGEFVTDKDDT